MHEETRNWREELELEEVVERWYDEDAVEIAPNDREEPSSGRARPAIDDVFAEMSAVLSSLEEHLEEWDADERNFERRIKDIEYDFEEDEVVVSFAFERRE